MSDNDMITSINFKIAVRLLENGIIYDPARAIPIASILCRHLKVLISTILQLMVQYKRKYLLFCPLLNRKRNPRRPHCSISTQQVYEKTLFSAKDLFQLLKDNEQVIPHRPVYHFYMERLLNHKSIKPSLEKEDVQEQSK